MNDDPADHVAKERRTVGMNRVTEVTRGSLPHPARGGTRGYPVWHRIQDLLRAAQNLPTDASPASHSRWGNRLLPYRMTGNSNNQSIVGADQLLAVTCITIWPDSTTDEVALFIYNEGGGVFTRGQVARRLKELGVTRKVGSTEAYEAFTPQNLFRAELFWTRSPPLGVVSIERRRFIDVDEFGVCLTRCNRKRGYAISFYRVRKPGHYVRNTKLTVLVAVEPGDPQIPAHIDGSIEKPRRWLRVLRNQGTTVEVFHDFINHICTDIEVDGVHNLGYDTDDNRVFLWDNLTSHLSHLITQLVEVRNGPTNFSIIPRPPYQPKYGPIEYIICDLVGQLAKDADREWTTDSLEQEINNRFPNLRGFWNTFDFCGYTITGFR